MPCCLYVTPELEIESGDPYLVSYALLFVVALCDYYEYTKDDAVTEDLFDTAKRQIDITERMLLEPEEKERVKGLIINKFRGDETILNPGIEMLENKGNVPVVGVVPYMELSLEDEDSLSDRFSNQKEGLIDIAVIHYPRISNFTDFNVFEQMEEVSVRYVTSPDKLHDPDLIILPGSKNTMADLLWMRQNGLEAMIKRKAASTPVWGICGGYQMLGAPTMRPL